MIVTSLAAPAEVGVTGLTVKDPHVIPVGSGVAQDNVVDFAVPAVRVAVTVAVPELPA